MYVHTYMIHTYRTPYTQAAVGMAAPPTIITCRYRALDDIPTNAPTRSQAMLGSLVLHFVCWVARARRK